jgi:hypothetical protein
MNPDFEDSIKQELARIERLELSEQPAEFGRLRDALEQALNQSSVQGASGENGGN